MKKFLMLCLLVFLSSSAVALSPASVEITDTSDEIEFKKNKFLAIYATDLINYEKISNQIDRDDAVGTPTQPEVVQLKTDFNSYAQRRFKMINKVFAVFRTEFDRCLNHLESLPEIKLPALTEFISVLQDSIEEAKIKGSKEKWAELKNRADKLASIAQNSENRQNYFDRLVLESTETDAAYFEAKISLLHRWLLEGRLDEATKWVEHIAHEYPQHPSCLGLQAHYWFEDYRRYSAGIDYKSSLEEKFAQQFGSAVSVTITLKGEKSLQKAFLFYLEALKKGYPEQQEIPGLLPAYWQSIEVIYKKIHPYWRYPQHLKKYQRALEELASKCQAIAEFVPFKKFATPAYKILDNVYRYWPEKQMGNKIIDFRELRRLSNIVSQKKF